MQPNLPKCKNKNILNNVFECGYLREWLAGEVNQYLSVLHRGGGGAILPASSHEPRVSFCEPEKIPTKKA